MENPILLVVFTLCCHVQWQWLKLSRRKESFDKALFEFAEVEFLLFDKNEVVMFVRVLCTNRKTSVLSKEEVCIVTRSIKYICRRCKEINNKAKAICAGYNPYLISNAIRKFSHGSMKDSFAICKH